MKSIDVSVIIPVYNTLPYLSQCLDSVLGQTLRNIEVICVDDGSEDGSLELLKEYAERDGRVKVIEISNSGPGKARNLAMAEAVGKYVAFVDSDDYIDRSMLSDLLKVAQDNDAQVVACAIEKFSSDRQAFGECSYKKIIGQRVDSQPFDWKTLGPDLFKLRFVCWNKIYRRDFLQDIKASFSEGVFYEDLIFFFTVMLRAERICYVNQAYYYNRRFRAGATTFMQGDRVKGVFVVMDALADLLKKNEDYAPLQGQFDAFRVEKYLDYFHKNDESNVVEFYARMQADFRAIPLEYNAAIPAALKKSAMTVRSESLLGFLMKEHYAARVALAKAKRRNRDLKHLFKTAKNRLKRQRPALHLVLMAGIVPFWIYKKLLSRLRKKTRRENERTEEIARIVESQNNIVISRIRKKVATGRPVKVGFVVSDRTKWNAQSILDSLRADPRFAPNLILCSQGKSVLGHLSERDDYLTERKFFAEIDPDLIDLYDVETGTTRSLEELDFDVLFYQHPWGMKRFPKRMLGRALGLYMHYGYMVTYNPALHYRIKGFHSYLWKYLCQSEEHKAIHLRERPETANQLVVTGYPKLDVYFESGTAGESVWRSPLPEGPRRRVIYAPHHSIGSNNKFRLSTFDWNYDLFLALARKHPEISWVYKPHSNLKFVVEQRGLMTYSEYAEYEEAWATLPNCTVWHGGDYFGLFKSSDVLITDCGSFLGEYLPTGNPIIRMISRNNPVPLNGVGEQIARHLYKAHDRREIEKWFNEVVMLGNDPMKEQRQAFARALFPGDKRATEKVLDVLLELVKPAI